MTKTITMALVATLGLGLAFGACAAEKPLAEVHGGQLPAETGWATKGQCLQCHHKLLQHLMYLHKCFWLAHQWHQRFPILQLLLHL